MTRTYLNPGPSSVDISFTTPDGPRTLTVTPGSRLTFDETAPNGADIDAACATAGMTQE